MINFSPIVKKITLATAGDTENLLQICLDAPFFGAKKLVPREEHFNPYGAANSTCHWSQPQNIKYIPYWKQLARPPQREFTKNEMVASRNATPFGLPGLPKRVSNTDIGVRLVRSTALAQSPEVEWRDCRLTAQLMSSSVQISHV